MRFRPRTRKKTSPPPASPPPPRKLHGRRPAGPPDISSRLATVRGRCRRRAKRLADVCTVMATCRLHGVDPQAYLSDVIRKIQDGWRSRLHELIQRRCTRQGGPSRLRSLLPSTLTTKRTSTSTPTRLSQHAPMRASARGPLSTALHRKRRGAAPEPQDVVELPRSGRTPRGGQLGAEQLDLAMRPRLPTRGAAPSKTPTGHRPSF